MTRCCYQLWWLVFVALSFFAHDVFMAREGHAADITSSLGAYHAPEPAAHGHGGQRPHPGPPPCGISQLVVLPSIDRSIEREPSSGAEPLLSGMVADLQTAVIAEILRPARGSVLPVLSARDQRALLQIFLI
jgi:hypothetical protein